MNKIELLAPAGDMDSLRAAIANGANAVYLGTSMFSARAYAKNFTLEEVKEAIEYAHLRNVRIYITINILYHDEEFKELFNYIDHFYNYQVDGLLIQDIGLCKAVRARYPDLEVHISTQMTLNSLEAVHYFEDLGVKRIVVSRENSIDEIRFIKENSPLEVEVFAHGALCVAYSGQCLMSSMIGKRSGNRGACAQPCRLPYQLKEDGKVINENSFLLSTKDLCTIDHLDEYLDAGVDSLKLEGRMKKPEYVAAITKAYRKAIDHRLGKSEDYTQDDIYDMKQMFNRNYTSGFPFKSKEIVDTEFSGNRGMPLGEVVSYNKKKRLVSVKLTAPLKQGDSVLFQNVDAGRPVNKLYHKGKLVNGGVAGDVIEIEFDTPVYDGPVKKTVSVETIKKLDATFDHEGKYRSISFVLHAHVGEKLSIDATSGNQSVHAEVDHIIETALHTPTDNDRITKQLGKLGNTIYTLNKCILDKDENINIPISLLNSLRREAIEKMNDLFMYAKKYNGIINELEEPSEVNEHVKDNYIVVMNTKQLEAVLDRENVYMYYDEETMAEAYEIFIKHNVEPAFYMPRINTDEDIKNIMSNDIVASTNKFIVNDYGLYRLLNGKEIIVGTGLNVFNTLSAKSFKEPIMASLECSRSEVESMSKVNENVIMQIYGKPENMITEYCVVSQHYFDKKVKHCHKCKGHTYSLVDRKGVEFTLMTDERCRNHIMHDVPLLIESYGSMNVSTMLFFTDEDVSTIHKVLNAYDTNSFHEYRKEISSTLGYFKA